MAQHGQTLKETKASLRARRSKKRVIYTFVFVLALVAAFALGFVLRGNEALVNRLGITSQISSSESSANSGFNKLKEVEQVLNSYAIYPFDNDAIAKDFLDSVAQESSDPYFKYYTTQQFASYQQDASSQNTNYGIGVLFTDNQNGAAVVSDVINDSPASRVGVHTGDILVSINGENEGGWTANEASARIAKEANKIIKFVFKRGTASTGSPSSEYSCSLKCVQTDEQNVTSSLDDGVGIITIKQISSTCADYVKEQVQSLATQGATSYILDLQNCTGGYITQAEAIADMFLDSGNIYTFKTTSGNTAHNATTSVITSKPIVVMTSSTTSAEAEVLAGALKYAGSCQVVGEKTAGVGVVQATVELSFGGAIRFTAGEYLLQNGEISLQGNGVKPTVDVPSSQKPEAKLNTAKQIAKSNSFN